MTPTAIRPEKIRKDLAKLWVDLAGDQHGSEGGVLRACAMTFIVAVDERDDAQAVGQTIAELMHEHPSRAIVLRIDGSNKENLDARVFAQCWMPFGKHQQICCEQIEIVTPENLLADVRKLLLGLTVPDLPVMLWVRCPQLASHPDLAQVFSLTSKIIIDSAQFGDPEDGFEFVSTRVRKGINLVDLEWTRLTPWRSLIAQIFENDRYRPSLAGIKTVRIGYSGSEAPVSARYLRTWFKHALPNASVRLEGGLAGSHGVARIEIAGEDFSATITRENGSAILKIGELTRRMSMPGSSDRALLREELSIAGPDPVFRSCFG